MLISAVSVLVKASSVSSWIPALITSLSTLAGVALTLLFTSGNERKRANRERQRWLDDRKIETYVVLTTYLLAEQRFVDYFTKRRGVVTSDPAPIGSQNLGGTESEALANLVASPTVVKQLSDYQSKVQEWTNARESSDWDLAKSLRDDLDSRASRILNAMRTEMGETDLPLPRVDQ